MEQCDELAQLEELLCADLEGQKTGRSEEAISSIKEVDIFQTSKSSEQIDSLTINSNSQIHNGDTDSSDDEEKRNYSERKYSSYGSEIKKILDNEKQDQIDRKIGFETRLRLINDDIRASHSTSFTKKHKPNGVNTNNVLHAPNPKGSSSDIFTDPIFGIRITKPLTSSDAFLDRMQGREAVNMLRVKRHVENEDLSKDWVIGGVIVRKSMAKKSQKGNQFLIWTLSDLKDDLKTVALFLFRKAYNDLWKTSEGTVVAVLNPNVLDKSQNNTDQACLSVENPDRVMILGQSKDLGVCKSRKKNGELCTAFVNKSKCEHCIFHVKQEYQKFSKRQELQSSTMGKGLINLQNKVLGKSSVIYGGKMYSALTSGNNKKVRERDENRLMSLSDYYTAENDTLMTNKSPYGAGPLTKNMTNLHSPINKKTSDSERLNKLSGSTDVSSNNHKLQSLTDKIATSPKFGKGFGLKGSGLIDLNISYGQKAAEKSKNNAIKLIQQCGGITKLDPNNIRGTEAGKKRALERLNSFSDENHSKKLKPSEETIKPKSIMTDRFKKILEATSAHQDLVRKHEDEEQDKYFDKLGKKEAMEEKMLNTFKIACKAVRCIKCKYTSFSASQLCKDERHPLKVLDTFKRFFKCADCGNRTVSLELIPLHSCKNCSSSRWEKTSMMREKKVLLSDGLSIRGEEESYIGGAVTTGKNINLLVPDS